MAKKKRRRIDQEEMDDQVYTYIRGYIMERCYPPSYHEIASHVKRSSSTVFNSIHRLKEVGKIETDKEGSFRAIRLPGLKIVEG